MNITRVSLPVPHPDLSRPALKIGMLIYPQMTALDFIAPNTVFSGLGHVDIYLAWKTKEAVVTDTGITMLPTATFDQVPDDLDILFVPGGDVSPWLSDPDVMAFLKSRGERARYVTSVCTRSLMLGAAGLLDGYQATSHWHAREHLRAFGAVPTAGRVIWDRNRVTAGGVTAGLNFGLQIAAELRGEEVAKTLQLVMEYDPYPPFDCGSPEKAGPEIMRRFEQMTSQTGPSESAR